MLDAFVEDYNGFRIYRGDMGFVACALWDSRIQLESEDIFHLRQMIYRWWHPEVAK